MKSFVAVLCLVACVAAEEKAREKRGYLGGLHSGGLGSGLSLGGGYSARGSRLKRLLCALSSARHRQQSCERP
ncbi:unnamed protein product [Parnassius apollo]|uniref:(apollo) hypothetical protein n=1 Tax=Parnassius apollo TaxID=110799 RepID=A0A8S3VZC6_PARAO|nr:unnamed protein product [Parnassius apollo]